MVAHGGHYLLQGHRRIGLHPEGKPVGDETVGIGAFVNHRRVTVKVAHDIAGVVIVFADLSADLPEEGPYAGVAIAGASEIHGIVNIGKTESIVRTFIKALFLAKEITSGEW